MKKLLLSVLSLFTVSAFSQWTATSIFFQGENITYANGNVLASDDGFNTYQYSSTEGVSWSTSGVSGVPATGLRFGIMNGSTLYAHYNDKIYQSTNGTTWSAMSAPTATSDVIKSMCVLSGTVFATSSPASGVSSKIWQLNGSTWSLKSSQSYIFTVIRGISGSLWAGTTSTLVMKSANAGGTFAVSNGTLAPANLYAGSMGATSSAMFFGTNGGRIYKSADGGNTWVGTYATGAGSSAGMNEIFITPSNAILVACDSGFVYSLDGTTWSKNNQGLAYASGNLTDQLLHVTMSANNIIVSTKNGKVYYRAASQVLAGIKEYEGASAESKVYPNPATDHVTISSAELVNEKNCEVIVTDVLGRTVSSTEMKNGEVQLNVSKFSKGIYSYTILNNKNAVSKGKLVVN